VAGEMEQLVKVSEELWKRELKERRVWLIGEINVYRAGKVLLALSALSTSNEPIVVFLNSVGGDLAHALAIYDAITILRKGSLRVDTIGIGLVASAAFILLQAGERRLLTPNSIVLIHEVASWTVGSLSEHEDSLKGLRKFEDRCLRILAERSGKSVGKLRKMFARRELWLTADEAVKHKFADALLSDLDIPKQP